MADWLSSMQQTFEYYTVDPMTWANVKLIDNVKSCTITRDAEAETLGSATFDIIESLGESYIRVYLITIQNGVKERYPLGTFLIQTPSSRFDGKIRSVSMDAYTPLLELKENPPPLGYYVPKTANVMDMVYQLTRNYARAPVVKANCSETLFYDFVADTNDTWLTFIIDLMKKAKYEFMLDEMGRILFAPVQETAALQPVWTYDDDNSSILYPDLDLDHDLYKIPNVVEVIYTDNNTYRYARVVNDDPNSPISTVNRGREITHRDSNPAIVGVPTEGQIHEYAQNLLKELSTLEYSVTYTHGYCPVRLGDCVRLNYERAGLKGIKAKVVSQSISCEPGCPVTEKAVFTAKLWEQKSHKNINVDKTPTVAVNLTVSTNEYNDESTGYVLIDGKRYSSTETIDVPLGKTLRFIVSSKWSSMHGIYLNGEKVSASSSTVNGVETLGYEYVIRTNISVSISDHPVMDDLSFSYYHDIQITT